MEVIAFSLLFYYLCRIHYDTYHITYNIEEQDIQRDLIRASLIAYPISYGLGKLVEKRSRRIESNFTQLLSDGESFLHEVVRAIRAIKAFIEAFLKLLFCLDLTLAYSPHLFRSAAPLYRGEPCQPAAQEGRGVTSPARTSPLPTPCPPYRHSGRLACP